MAPRSSAPGAICLPAGAPPAFAGGAPDLARVEQAPRLRNEAATRVSRHRSPVGHTGPGLQQERPQPSAGRRSGEASAAAAYASVA